MAAHPKDEGWDRATNLLLAQRARLQRENERLVRENEALRVAWIAEIAAGFGEREAA